MRPRSNARFGGKKRNITKKRPRSDTLPKREDGLKFGIPYFLRVVGRYCYLVARPRYPEDVPLGCVIPASFWGYLTDEQKGQICMGLRKPFVGGAVSPEALVPNDPGSKADFPSLFAYLSDDQWEDGSPRMRSTLIIFCEGDTFKACLTDKDNDLTLWAASRTLVDLFGSLEGRLGDPEADWRKRVGPKQVPKKKG